MLTDCAAVGIEKRLVLTVCGAVGRAIEEASEEDYYNESATCDGTQIVDLWDAIHQQRLRMVQDMRTRSSKSMHLRSS